MWTRRRGRLLNDSVRDRADAFGLPRADCEVPWKYPGVHIKLMVECEGESSDKYSSHEYVTCRTQFELRACIKLLGKSIRTENRTEPGEREGVQPFMTGRE